MILPPTRHSHPVAQFAFLISICIVPLTPTETESQVFIRSQSGTSNRLWGVDFIDDSVGLVVGDYGTILRTTDAGSTWETVSSGTTVHLSCVGWLSRSSAIAAGFSGTILRTGDAGRHWAPVSSGITLPLAGCAGWDSLNALVAGYNGFILRTTDGGISWTVAIQQPGSNHLGVSYADSLTVSVSGSYGRILRSTDGGITWTWRSFGTFTINDVDFVDSLNGIAVGNGGNIVLRTSDAGASWTSGSLPGTFEDVDHASDRSAVAAGIGTVFSSDIGATWSAREPPARFRGVAVFDSARYLLVGDNGLVLRTAVGTIDPPPPVLSHPPDGTTDAPLSPDWQKAFSLALSWRDYEAYFPDSVRLQVSDEPNFAGSFLRDSTYRIAALPDTQRLVRRVYPGKPHFWRVRMIFDGVESPWSETWSFTGSVAHALFSVRDVQSVPADSLILADSLTAIARDRWLLQASPLFDNMVFVILRCVSDPGDLYDPYFIYEGASAGQFFYAVDTGATGSAWRGIKVTPGWFYGSNDLVEAFSRVRAGDLIVCAGVISEDPPTMNSETSVYAHWLFVIDSAGAIPPPSPASVGDFFRHAEQNILPRYATGEPLEGGYVELTDLTVHSTANASNGTFNVTTREGLRISTADFSRWFTLRSHRDPASGYQVPFVGRPIDTLRGFIATTSGDQNSWTFPRFRIVPVTPGDMVFGAPTGNLLRGTVFYDSSRNGVRDPGEPGVAGWHLSLGGLVAATLGVLPDGSFSAPGLDSGAYALQLFLPEGWFVSSPGPTTLDFMLGIGDTVEPPPFGLYFGWNRISGTVFDDTNENGSLDAGEPGLPGVLVHLAGAGPDSTVTDESGEYNFDYAIKGMNTVSIRLPAHWEQIVPMDGAGIAVDFREYNRHVADRDFSLRRSPLRVKIGITMHDSGDVALREIFFGTRPGASYGIWGADISATFIDFSEGEFEIPPQIFGLYDVRFVDPRGGLESFGEGTWTDIRDFRFGGQVDSFRIDFQPGILFGGNYPMRFYWSHAEVESSYTGAVVFGDSAWTPLLDMKTADSLIVVDTSTGILTILAEGPVLRVTDMSGSTVEVPEFALIQNYPNPFNPATSITYSVAARSQVTLRIYDLLGREVVTLVDKVKSPGEYIARWASGDHPTGVYFCRMTAGRYNGIRKMLVVK